MPKKKSASKKVFRPKIGKNVFIDPSAQVMGQVTLGDYSSVWSGCVLRGDINKISVGKYTNIQDLSILHVETNQACKIGNYVTVGHMVNLHGCTVKDNALVGIGSIVLDGAVIGESVILGAGSLVTHGQKLKKESLYFGKPAKFVRKLTAKEIDNLTAWAKRYVSYAKDHMAGKFERVQTDRFGRQLEISK